MIRLSVNVNKVATLRNSRGGSVPDVIEAVRVCLAAGAPGVTVHPRADARHITTEDVEAIAAELSTLNREGASASNRALQFSGGAAARTARPRAERSERERERVERAAVRGGAPMKYELNIEGDPRPDLVALVRRVRPDQCTLVPVVPGEITSQAGWSPANTPAGLPGIIRDLQARAIRVSLFVEADVEAVAWAASLGADRVEIYTEPFARAFEQGPRAADAAFSACAEAARAAHAHGLGVNAGHDLDLANLPRFRDLPYLAEVSIGHALISRALFHGLAPVVREYLRVLAPRRGTSDAGDGRRTMARGDAETAEKDRPA